MIDVPHYLEEGEQTPDWDMQKLRGIVARLSEEIGRMPRPEYDRYLALKDRFVGRMRGLLGAQTAK